MAYNLAPVLKQKFTDANDDPLVGGKLYTYQSGTTTPQATYVAAAGAANANPIILDANGECDLWLDPALSYKFVLKNSSDVTQWTVDSVIGTLVNDSVTTAALQALSVTAPKLDGATISKSNELMNLALTASVAANALTISVKTKALADATATTPITIGFRNATLATGDYVQRTVTGALSVVVSSGSTLGFTSAVGQYLYVYAIDNAGTVELAVSGTPVFADGTLQSTTAEGGAGAADSGVILYSTTARTTKAVRLIGRIFSTQATAGTWASAPTEIAVAPFKFNPLPTVQRFSSGSSNYTTPAGVTYFKVKMVGGGGGGGGSGSGGGTGATGGNTTFGSSLITANGGLGGVTAGWAGIGGTATVSAPAIQLVAVSGGGGGPAFGSSVSGAMGGNSILGGGGAAQLGGSAGIAGATNTGGGGGGAPIAVAAFTGAGGGAGGGVEAIIVPTAGQVFAYAVGAGGTGGTAGTSGQVGGAGGSGVIIVEEYYN